MVAPKDKQIKLGDIYFINLATTKGAEMRGKRPVLVIQNNWGNRYSPTILVAVMRSNLSKTYPFQVMATTTDTELPRDSIVMLDQIQTLSTERFVETKVGRLSKEKMLEIYPALTYELFGRVIDEKMLEIFKELLDEAYAA